MAKKMLIDATHPEETRVVVADGNKVDEFDFESLNKRQLAGNIYLAKVTRVEPSLQAAFVDYGGNRHGFLAFSEIHPDYYQIPVADREALLREEREYAEAQAREEAEAASKPKRRRRRRKGSDSRAEDSGADAVSRGDAQPSGMDVIDLEGEADEDSEALAEAVGEDIAGVQGATDDEPVAASDEAEADESQAPAEDQSDDQDDEGDEDDDDTEARAAEEGIDTVADDDAHEDIRPARKPRPRKYKIQEVIKVRQIMLVQVVKEERGNKGAALTTYLSLAGRYCVLMPNTARGGGISRKITQATDRKKLKDIAVSLDVPQGAGLIIRTAGAQRTKTEIKRDYEYLQRQWEQIRELTLKSIAPAPIYEEGNLIHRSIRDLYSKDIDEVLVEGEAGYRQAKDFMKMIMPSHAKNVKHYHEGLPLFARFQVEGYLADMFNPVVQLKSGGYIVIGVTEALVAIDVNSGKATKEGSIEETALKTNLEAAEEVARQLRLRDLAGLIVIDFIDMDERRNNNSVEKRLKDALKTDRARIQVGRISAFGLLEMSRQRLRPGMLEATTQACAHCHGTGLIRSDDSLALSILRQLEEEGTRRRTKEILLTAPVGIINFIVNHKREYLAELEGRYGLSIRLEAEPTMIPPDYRIEKFKTATRRVPEVAPILSMDAGLMDAIEEAEEAEALDVEVEEQAEPARAPEAESESEGGGKKRRRRRRGGRGRRKDEGRDGKPSQSEAAQDGPAEESAEPQPQSEPTESPEPAEAAEPAEAVKEKPKRRSRSRSKAKPDETQAEPVAEEASTEPDAAPAESAPEEAAEPVAEEAPAKKPRSRRKAPAKTKAPAAAEEPAPQPEPAEAVAAPDAKSERPAPEPKVEPEPEPVGAASDADDGKPKRRGWWSLGK
ncbi:Rne/Rng family ribonuclease [Rhodobacterales bacterium HKCCE3408]|nr:Rne/Rng family ribonuclease [Rhodobacterales bacterium HKCCE3408]